MTTGHPLERMVYDRFAQSIAAWDTERHPDIYAVSLLYDSGWSRDAEGRDAAIQNQIGLSFNTEAHLRSQVARASSPEEARWNFAFWLQEPTAAVPRDFDYGADPPEDDLGAGVVARLLAPGGRLFVFEGHPLDWVWDTGASEYRLDPERGDYFSRSPNDPRWPMPLLDAMGRDPDAPRARERQWTLGDVLNALGGAGLVVERFGEHPDLYWGQFPRLPDDLARRLPHTFSLLMRKPAD